MNQLKELRMNRSLLQKDVAAFLGITQQAYANYERGARYPDPSTLIKLSEFFGVSVDYLIGNDGKKNKPSIHKDEGLSEDALRVAEKFSRLTPEDQSKVEEYVALLASKDRQ